MTNQIQSSKLKMTARLALHPFRISNFGFDSSFEFRTSDFPAHAVLAVNTLLLAVASKPVIMPNDMIGSGGTEKH
jgi:hypothetical protein